MLIPGTHKFILSFFFLVISKDFVLPWTTINNIYIKDDKYILTYINRITAFFRFFSKIMDITKYMLSWCNNTISFKQLMHKWSLHTYATYMMVHFLLLYKHVSRKYTLHNPHCMYIKREYLPHCYELAWKNYKHSNILEAWLQVHSLSKLLFLMSYEEVIWQTSALHIKSLVFTNIPQQNINYLWWILQIIVHTHTTKSIKIM